MTIDQLMVDEARRIAATHGQVLTPFRMREAIRDARTYRDMGMDWREATDHATTHALRLYGQEPPWAGK